MNKQKIDDILIYLEDNDSNTVNFNGETLTSTVMPLKISQQFYSSQNKSFWQFQKMFVFCRI